MALDARVHLGLVMVGASGVCFGLDGLVSNRFKLGDVGDY